MNREQELIDRIRQLEEINSVLQDKLDMIYSIVAPDDADIEESVDDEAPHNLVQIDIKPKRPS